MGKSLRSVRRYVSIPTTRSHIDLGVALGNKGGWDEEIFEERETIRLDPSDAFAHGGLGYTLAQKNNLDEAVAELHESIRLDPNDDFVHCFLGQALGDKGDWVR